MEKSKKEPTNDQVKQLRGWRNLQYKRFLTAVIDEGKELVKQTSEYWREEEQPEKLVWANLSVTVIDKLVENVRKRLIKDDVETKMPLDSDVVKWKLQPWLRKKQDKRAHQSEPAEPSATRARQSPTGQPDPGLVGTGVRAYQAEGRPRTLPYDPIKESAGENSEPA